jgi:hypothetical protein
MVFGRIRSGDGARTAGPQAAAVPDRARGQAALGERRLLALTEALAVGFPDRVFGSAQGEQAAAWIADRMKRLGLLPGCGNGYLQAFECPIGEERWTGFNVAGLLPGTDPKLKDEFVIVAAHHDSQQGTRQGANDNATGCAVVLAVAEALAASPPRRSVLFVTFDGEESVQHAKKVHPGRRGSRAYAARPLVPLSRTALMVNLDMVGQVHLESGPRSDVHQWSSKDALARQVLARANAALRPDERPVDGYPEQHPQAQMFTTDAEPLYRVGVPVVNFLSGRDLDNHATEDAMPRVIPERIEQYARLAHRVTVEAADHPESLSSLGIAPGGLMPSYSLIRAHKAAGLAVTDEERLRLDELAARLPRLKLAAHALVQALARPELSARAGMDLAALARAHGTLACEAALHEVRSTRAATVVASHELPKGELHARKEAMSRLEALGGIEDVLAGAIYLEKLSKKQSYYLQRIPERLADLSRGARRLGLEGRLEGVVQEKDLAAFAPTVSAERAVVLAKESLADLGRAVGIAVSALLDPERAAREERPVNAADLAALHRAAGRPSIEGRAPAEQALLRATLESQLLGLKGSGPSWLARFAAKNALTDFAAAASALRLEDGLARTLGQAGEQLRAAVRSGDTGAISAALPMFYGPLLEHAFGAPQAGTTADTLRELSRPGALAERLAAPAVASGSSGAGGAPGALTALVRAALELSRLYDAASGALLPGASLADVKASLEDVIDAARAHGSRGGAELATELAVWPTWVEPFLALEGVAGTQARERLRAVDELKARLAPLWAEAAGGLSPRLELGPELRASPRAAAKALEKRIVNAERLEQRDRLAELARERVAPYALAEEALLALSEQPSPLAEGALRDAVRALGAQLGEADIKGLRASLESLTRLHALEDAQLGRKDRGGPLGVLGVRLLQQREEA